MSIAEFPPSSFTAVTVAPLAPGVPPLSETLRVGAVGNHVRQLQFRLVALGYVLVVDGIFGAATKTEVELFEVAHLVIPTTGVVDRALWSLLWT